MSNHVKSKAGLGLSVEVRNNDIAKASRRLKKLVTNDGLVKEIRDRKEFTKPSTVKRLAKKAARKRWLKKQSQMDNR
jgi:ribosomal protein S21